MVVCLFVCLFVVDDDDDDDEDDDDDDEEDLGDDEVDVFFQVEGLIPTAVNKGDGGHHWDDLPERLLRHHRARHVAARSLRL